MKRLLLDIETAPNVVHAWGIWQQNIGINQIVSSSYTLCWAAKWHGGKEIFFDSVHQSKPKKMLEGIYRLISEADTVVHYNGKSFDIPTLNKEFLLQGMTPPPPYKQVDLCNTAKGQFRFPSNKLEYIARQLKIGEKVKHEGHELWTACMAGDKEAWKRMEAYNRQDIVLLEKLYTKLLPWVRNHPNAGVYNAGEALACPACDSTDLINRGWYRTNVNQYKRMSCKACGTWSRQAWGDFSHSQRGNLARSVPQN